MAAEHSFSPPQALSLLAAKGVPSFREAVPSPLAMMAQLSSPPTDDPFWGMAGLYFFLLEVLPSLARKKRPFSPVVAFPSLPLAKVSGKGGQLADSATSVEWMASSA